MPIPNTSWSNERASGELVGMDIAHSGDGRGGRDDCELHHEGGPEIDLMAACDPGREPLAGDSAEEERREGDEWRYRRESGRTSDAESEQHDVAGRVGGEHVVKTPNASTGPVGERQRYEAKRERVSEARALQHATSSGPEPQTFDGPRP
jgi:hypothetical protein